MAATAHPALPPVPTPAGSSAQRGSLAIRAIARGISLWHLLSLDAPTVAMLWTWFLARTNHIRLPASAVLAMGTAVWMLYAADRLLDSRAISATPSRNPASPGLEPRHYFHRNHQEAFRCGILAATAVLAFLLPRLEPQSIRLYLALGALLLGYFILIHVNSAATQEKAHRLPKELAVGFFFSAAVFIPTVARNPGLRLALIPGAILFAVLCSLNCLFICAWEHPAISLHARALAHSTTHPATHPATHHATHPTTRIALRFLPRFTLTAAASGLALALIDRSLPWPIPAACALGAILLLLLHRSRSRLSPTTLRAAADICLLTPVLFLFY